MKNVTIDLTNQRIVALTQPHGALRYCLQHRLQIRRRSSNHAQNLARRGLLLQGLGAVAVAGMDFVKQPHVLDGDHGLVGEGIKKGDLLVREGTDLCAANHNCPDWKTLTQQWCGKQSTSARNLPSGFGIRELGLDFCLHIMDVDCLLIYNGTARGDSTSEG